MPSEGIDLQIIYPTGGLMLSRVREPDYAIALVPDLQRLARRLVLDRPKRLKGVALVPLHVDVRAAIDEMERAMSKLGAVGVMVNTYDRSRNVAHRDFWPFYEECAQPGRRGRVPRLGQRHARPARPFREFPADPHLARMRRSS